jgi:hypothetical protein
MSGDSATIPPGALPPWLNRNSAATVTVAAAFCRCGGTCSINGSEEGDIAAQARARDG